MTATLAMQLNIDKSTWTLVKFGDVVPEGRETVRDFAAEKIGRVVGLEHIDSETGQTQENFLNMSTRYRSSQAS